MTPTPRPVQRILISLLAAGGVAIGGVLSAAVVAEGRPHPHPGVAGTSTRIETIADVRDGHGHVHNDPTTKNAISRSGEAADAPDRTTPRQRAASRARVAAQRTLAEPRLRGVPLRATRLPVPETVYAMAGGCYRLGGRPSPSRRRGWAPTSSTPPTARSSPRPGPEAPRGRPPRPRRPTGRRARRAGAGSPSPSPTAARCGVPPRAPGSPPAAPSPWRCAGRPAARPSPKSGPTSADARSAA